MARKFIRGAKDALERPALHVTTKRKRRERLADSQGHDLSCPGVAGPPFLRQGKH
jgi:hypothetical protein